MTRRAIQALPADLVNRIAAGEVIERPASVVKELVENALDAGAMRITIEIENGGTSLIRVIDDGGGIPADELPLAFAQHATSKVRDDAELAAVATMGFRGEALASIGSVARCRILSRCGEAVAHEIRNDGGAITDIRAPAGNAGTTVEIRDLFFNVPARRKFLKSHSAESGQVTDIVTRLALPRPEVHFRYIRDGKTVSDWPATTLVERLLVAWPGEYHERSLELDVVDAPRDNDGGQWRLGGIVGLPEYATNTGRYQHLYVNGRPVKDRSVVHALREAFRGLTEPGRHPAAILLLSVDPADVDVNVHPTKAEVRFRRPNRVWGLVHSAVRELLLANDLTPKARPNAEPPAWTMPRENVRETLASFFKTKLDEAQAQQGVGERGRQSDDEPPADQGIAASGRDAGGVQDTNGFSSRPASRSDAATHDDEMPSRSVAADDDLPPARAIQLHNSYLVVQSDEGMEIIDQHALHERILFEELLGRMRRGPLESQRLLLPMTFDAPEAQVALLDELRPTLERIGIEAAAFGPDTVAVQAFPSFLTRLDPVAFMAGVLEKAEVELQSAAGNEEELLHDVLDMMACKAAVKAGDPLSPSEIEALVARRHLTGRISNCPHGRPTTLKLSLGDLEKQFKRTGF